MKKTNIRKSVAVLLAGLLCAGVTVPQIPVSELPVSAAVYTSVPDGYIGIYSADDLNNIRNSLRKNYILMNDIDLSGMNWTPIGTTASPFRGIFDGNGYAVRNMTISGEVTSNTTGLFGACSTAASITRLALVDCNINVTVPESFSAGNTYIYIGGILGYNGKVSKCYATGSIRADVYCSGISNTYCIGGLCGMAFVHDSFSNGSVTVNAFNTAHSQTSFDIGGTAGYSADFTNCYHAGTVSVTKESSASYNIGSVCGYSSGSLVYFQNVYYLNSNSGYAASGTEQDSYYSTVAGYQEDQMKEQSNFAFDFDTVWGINPGAAYPYPTLKEVPYAGNSSSQPAETETTTTTTETTTTETTTTTSTTPETTTTTTTSTTPETTTTTTTSTTPETTTTTTTFTTPETTTSTTTSTTPETTTTTTTSTTPETTTTTTTSTTPETTTTDIVTRLDMNHDGLADAYDASLLLQYAAAAGTDTLWQAPYEVQSVAGIGDIDSDGSVSAADSYLVLRYAALAGTGKQVSLEDLF